VVNREPKGSREGGRFASSADGKDNVPTAVAEAQSIALDNLVQSGEPSNAICEIYDKFKDYIPVFRGLEDITNAKDITFDSLGVHWSADSKTALEMAVPEWALEDDDVEGNIEGSIVYGLVHPDHIMKLDSPEMEGWEGWRMDGEHWEAEQTIRPGSPIQIIKVEKVSHNKGTGVLSEEPLVQGVPREGIA